MKTKMSEWDRLKAEGSDHYKTGKIEPIDLYRSAGVLKHFAIGCIIKYAFRNANQKLSVKDMDKVIHYAKILKVLAEEEK